MKKKITAAELMATLNKDPDYLAARAREEEERQRRASELRRAEVPVVEALRAAGYAVDSVWDLVNTAAPYESAIPILLAHLARPYPGLVREGIARALAVPEAKSGWTVLCQLYRDEQDVHAKDGLAVALAAISDQETIGDVMTFARDPSHGPSRLLLLSALERSDDPRAKAALSELRSDPELKNEVQAIVRRRRKRLKR